jgi:hypothetical protein
MAGHEASRILLCAGLLLTAGCASSRTPEPVRSTQAPSPAQTPPSPAVPPVPTEPAPPAPAPAVEAGSPETEDKANVVVVDAGDEEDGPQTLVEAARAERERRAGSTPTAVVINDKNLQEYARKGQITVVDPSKVKRGKEAGAAAVTAAPPAQPGEPVRDEPYWRNRGLEIRQRWRQAADDSKELEEKAASLRQRFYAEDDPYVRNNRIKPEWDRTLDQLRQARVEIETSKQELTEFLEEGRVAGVYPGWLREGFDLEPEEEEPTEETRPAESIEPPVMEPPR